MKDADGFLKIFSIPIRRILEKAPMTMEYLQEIRLRIGGPLLVRHQGEEYGLTESGNMKACKDFWDKQAQWKEIHRVTKQELQETLEYLAGYSLYAYEEELRQGFLTIQGGHRVGVAGKVVLEAGRIRGIRHISFLNVRLAHQVKGCANGVLPFVIENGEVCHTLIVSPPGAGKTTLLRDMVRQISDGNAWCAGKTVGVVDERSEIGGAYQGLPQNDLGMRTDLLDCCPKAEGMMMLIRSMAPQVMAVDEIGDYEDIHAIETVLHCGCRLIATVHGSSLEDIREKPLLQKLTEHQVFERYIILEGGQKPGRIREILDRKGKKISGKEDAEC